MIRREALKGHVSTSVPTIQLQNTQILQGGKNLNPKQM